MCFGYDGDAALRESLERKGASRRGLIRGAAAGAAGATVLAGSPAFAGKPGRHPGKGHGHDHGRQREVPTDLISIQLYTLRAAMTDRAAILRQLDQLAKFGYERVERAGLYPKETGLDTAAKLKAEFDARGIWASSSHDGISTVDGDATRLDPAKLNKKLDDANTFRQKYIVVPYLNSTSKADWQRWAEQMNTEAAAARRRGLRYGYHNHAHEFTIDLGGGLTPWDILTSELDRRLVHLEVDLYWAYTGGVNTGAGDPLRFAIDVIRSAPQEVRQYHVKDRHGADAAALYEEEPGDMADLGLGVIDFPAIFKKHQVEEYIVENDTPDFHPAATANTGFRYLEGLQF
ncbi:sugar phosphate isomerase/epimerase [Nocardioides sp. zg-1228]|uniref:sugar phosphate isomerase/epimerase family protein n=1 Tax=Nocardioides sp. zg-1228 TaxID=2763008 RepID=UPI0016435A8C|nr:sugar phosphate isomerase/epimerase [Nocardioides sp. zg-1228]MBC2932473.1 sugar phosphate isomerase/epimerase [Nocardioides sp. zg-1228]QSF57980.1 sugar phosphate isomerase/epimerase [Nocardioides sp. zg-1228]